MTNNEKAKGMRSTQCVRDCRCLISRVSSLYELDMVKFSDFDY